MLDRYGNSVTTHSAEAFDAYCLGVDLLLGAQAGGIEALIRATEVDPGFALAHADLARALQIAAKPTEARAHIEKASTFLNAEAASVNEQERAHIEIMEMLLGGKGAEAFEKIKSHITRFPRDVLTVQPCCGVFGLIGFSGRAGREQENADFMAALHKHYQGDWWFESQYAFALCETGQLADAETLNEAAFTANPKNANAVHHRAHIHYETREFEAGRAALNNWRDEYSRDGILHCHLAWHDALWALAAKEPDRLWQIISDDILPEVTTAPPINVLTDLVAVLVRAQLAGYEAPMNFWEIARDYSHASFPRPGVSFADAHSVIAYAHGKDAERLAAFSDSGRGWSADLVTAIAAGFEALFEGAWRQCVEQLQPIMRSHERLGGSRAQRDLIDLGCSYAQLKLGQNLSSARVRDLIG